MRALVPLVVLPAFLAGCEDVEDAPDPGPLLLAVSAPLPGAFLGDGPAVVEGRVWPPSARLLVEGATAVPDGSGAFRAEVPVDGPWRVLDVEASRNGDHLRERIPVFRGHDPATTWPGGLPVRLLPAGLALLGPAIGPRVDATGWDVALTTALPTVDLGWLAFVPAGVTHAPTRSTLAPASDGLTLGLQFRDVTVDYDAILEIAGASATVPLSLVYGTVALGTVAVPSLDATARLTLVLTEATVDLADPDVTAGPLDGTILEWVLGAVEEVLAEPLAEALLVAVTDALGRIDLGGPYGAEVDLAGTGLDLDLRAIRGDPGGLALGFAAGIDEPSPDPMPDVPVPGPGDAPGAQAVVGLHEYLLDSAIRSQALAIPDLGSLFGELVGSWVRGLPGGEEAPPGDGWCVAFGPGPASVVRLQDTLDPLAVLYLPDARLDVDGAQGSACEDWLEASLAVEVGFAVEDGTRFRVDVAVVEGAVLAYGAQAEEADVVEGLASLVETIMGFIGRSAEVDLSDLFPVDATAWGLPPMRPAILGSTSLCRGDGACPEGLHAVAMDLFDDTRSIP